MKILDVPQSGSIAGSTSSRNRFGQYRRTRAIPTNPRSEKQTVIRSRLAQLSRNFGLLTPDKQQGWLDYSQQHPTRDSLGQSIVLTPSMMYVGINSRRIQTGESESQFPPSAGENPLFPTLFGNLTIGTSPISAIVSVLSGTISATDGDMVIARISDPLSPGVTYCRKFPIYSKVPAPVSPSVEIDLTNSFPTDPVAGKKYIVEMQIVNDGVIKTRQTLSAVASV